MSICPHCGHIFGENVIIERDGFVIDPRGSVTFEGRPLQVRPSGLIILHLLAAAGGRIVKNAVLLDALSNPESSKILPVQVKYLRYALESGGAPDVVRTNRMNGYSWGLTLLEGSQPERAMRTDRGDLTDAEWKMLAPLMPPERGKESTIKNHRRFLDGMLYVLRRGCTWAEIDKRYGKWNTVYIRFRRWAYRGVWDDILPVLVDLGITDAWRGANTTGYRGASAPDGNAAIVRQLLIDRAEMLKAKTPLDETLRETLFGHAKNGSAR